MLDNKFFLTIIGLFVAIFALCKTNFCSGSKEGWFNYPRTVKVYREVQPRIGNGKSSSAPYSLQNNFKAILGDNKFVSYPSMTSDLSPRFANVGFGANIRYNMPDNGNMAAPRSPLTFAQRATEGYKPRGTVKEGYDNGSGSQYLAGANAGPTCGKGGLPIAMHRVDSNPVRSSETAFQNAMSTMYSSNMTTPTLSDAVLPVGDMNSISASGEIQQSIVYDRFVFANAKSRLRAQGDPIRGDLAIVPSNTGWFNVSVTPNIDLNQGAMNVMGGFANETASQLTGLINKASGGVTDAIGGVSLSNNNPVQLSTGQGDIRVSAYA